MKNKFRIIYIDPPEGLGDDREFQNSTLDKEILKRKNKRKNKG